MPAPFVPTLRNEGAGASLPRVGWRLPPTGRLSQPATRVERMFDLMFARQPFVDLRFDLGRQSYPLGLEELASVRADVEVIGGTADLDTLVGALTRLERLARAVDATRLALVSEISRRGEVRDDAGIWRDTRLPVGEVAETAADVVAAATGLSPFHASRLTRLTARTSGDLADLVPALTDGAVPTEALQLVADQTEDASPEAVTAVVAHLLENRRGTDRPRVEVLDRHDLAQACRRTLDRVDAGWRQARAAKNRAEHVGVRTEPGPMGTTLLTACLPSEAALVLSRAVETRSAEMRQDQPELKAGPARARALLDLALRGVEVSTHVTLGVPVVMTQPPGAGGAAPGAPREDAGISLVPTDGDDGPPWLTGVEVRGIGWIPPDVVQTLTSRLDSRVTRVLLDQETGTTLETSTSGYVPTPSMRRLVELRDDRCRMWGCSRPAGRCDLDHAVPHPEGETCGHNLGALCRHHHRVKQSRHWSYELLPDGAARWTAPGGVELLTFPAAWTNQGQRRHAPGVRGTAS